MLYLTIQSGPSKGWYKAYGKTVIVPSGTRMTRVNPNHVYHKQYAASVGIRLYYWLDPTEVSFKYLAFAEGSCPSSNVSGFYLTCEPWNSYPNGTQMRPHEEVLFGAILGGDIGTGCRVYGVDRASTGDANPWDAGSFTWVIPSEYIDGTGSHHSFGSQTQVGTYDENGYATVTKGAAEPGSAASIDPDSPWVP